jgi:endonuclease YncB( thermonuclease family)
VDATFALLGLIREREVVCEGRFRDQYGRPLDLDFGSAMDRSGWALAEWHADYRSEEEQAKAERAGAWAGTFERPKDWRKRKARRLVDPTRTPH